MQTGDVLVVGNGTDSNTRNTALRITEDTTVLNGKVIISTPQGDISMGIYQ
jgi:flagellar biosynthesis/type III secretory pathway protein FliH